MRHNPLAFLVAAGCLLAGVTPSWALQSQTWVSPTGTDTGICFSNAPCRSFQFALGQTAANGVVNVLASGDFGPMVITKSVSVVSDGAEGAIYKSGPSGAIVINGTNIDVSLRGLTIDLFGSNDGIRFIAGKALHISGCTIRGTRFAIAFTPSAGPTELHVSDTVITRPTSFGVEILPSGGGAVTATLEHIRVEYPGDHGVIVYGSAGGVNATVRNSVIANTQSGTGIYAAGSAGAHTTIMIDHTAIVNNHGIAVFSGGATVRIGDSTITGNTNGFVTNSGGTIMSYGTNKVDGNVTNGAPTSTIGYE